MGMDMDVDVDVGINKPRHAPVARVRYEHCNTYKIPPVAETN